MTDSIPRTSFFDDDDVNITFEFKKPENKHQKDLNSEPLISNILLKKSRSEGPLQQGCYTLYNNTLAYYKANPSGQPDAVLDLAHSRVQPIPASMVTSYYGFVVTRNGNKFEFYSPDEKTIDNWVNALRSVCVLTNFHDEYKALKMIGKGSFAKVYLVESKTNGKTFAVKAFTKESVVAANKANAKPCMMNEIDIMRVMDNDNVIRLYEVYETEKSIYLVLELVQGRSLQEILKKGGFKDNESRVINIMSSLLEALAYLASKGVMHRDLKPDNILVDKCDKIKIVDFGLATFIDVPEYIFKKCGTPGYIAPEVFKYDQKNPATHYDAHCDVFSAGCIMYFMLFGTPFFDGPNASEILKINRRFTIEFAALNNAKQEFKNPSSKIPKEALDLTLQLLEFDQKNRPSASQALNHSYIYSVVSQKMAGFYDFYQNGGGSPTVFDKRGSFAQEVMSGQLKSGTLASPQPRFTEKDSLYLDVGRPEITGKIDTLTSGSANNSMHVVKGGDSSPVSPSKFAKDAPQNRSFRQASLLRTIQQGPEGGLIRLEEVKNDQRHSEFSRAKEDYSPGGFNLKLNPAHEAEDISHEHPQIKTNGEKTPVGGLERHSSKVTDPTAKRFSLLSNQAQGTHEKGI